MSTTSLPVTDTDAPLPVPPDRLWTKSFVALLTTQFLVALNDNVFRWLIIPIGKCAVGWSSSPDMVRMVGALVFLLPFLLLTAYAGYCTDRFNRRTVIIGCKIAEVLILLFGTVAILMQSVPLMLVTLSLLGAQSAFFSPAKYSALPSLIPTSRISEANGFYSMTTMIACVAGQLIGGFLFVWTTALPDQPIDGTGGMSNWWIWAGTLVGIAVAGLISSLFIPSLKAVDPGAKFPINPFYQTFADLRFLFRHRFLFWVCLGSAFFWGLGALAQSNIDKFATEMLHVRQDYAMILLVALTLGLAGGAMLSGWWARGRVELGLVPVGVAMIILFAIFLSATPSVELAEGNATASCWTAPFLMGAFGLFMLGVSAGIYDIPLLTTLQTQSPVESRGRILAASNFYSFAAMAIFSLFQGVLAAPSAMKLSLPGLSATGIWFVCALLALPILIITIRQLFMPLLRVLVSAFLWVVYRPRIIGLEHIPETGGVLLIGNHVSYIDSLLLYCYCRRPIRFIAHSNYVPKGFPRVIAKATGLIQFVPSDRKSVVGMVRQARQALAAGDVVCIFPEGGITRTGQINPFQPGFLALIKGNEETIPIIPFFLGGLWGSVFAYAKPAVKRILPFGLIQRVTVAFGEPLYAPKCVRHVQNVVEELGVDVMSPTRFPNDRHLMVPPRLLLRNCRRYPRELRLADSTGAELNGRQVLLRTLVLRRFLHRLLGDRQKNSLVGLLFPTSAGGVLVNAAISLDRRVPVNLNFTFTNETNNYCLKKLGITHVLATKRLLQRLPNLNLDAEVIELEDAAAKGMTKWDKIIGLIESFLPIFLLERLLGLTKIQQDDLNTIVLTSGSTGFPKGAMLTHANVSANVQGFYQAFRPTLGDKILSSLPLFHSYGYSTMAWFPLVRELAGIYHYSPLEAKVIGELAQKYQTTIFASTPTFFRNYLRRCSTECFSAVGCVVAGAEKLPNDLAVAWEEKYGQELVEGFGITELAPVLSVNIPDCRRADEHYPYQKRGSVGRPIPGFVVRIVDLETGEQVMPGEQGMLEVKGHSVMQGYFEDPEKTKEAFHDGWYVTGDIGRIDEEGFIFITGRQTRMSKIGGEMVPHILIEERLWEVTKQMEALLPSSSHERPVSEGASDELEMVQTVVTAVPDEKKGEKIVVLYTSLPGTPEEICKRLLDTGLPQIWVPAPINFRQIEKIPMLGTGKFSLKEIKDLAQAIYE